MREWNVVYGHPPTVYEWNPQLALNEVRGELARELWDRFYETPGRWPHVGTVQKRFGSWNAGLAAAGFEPRGPRDRVSREPVAA